jgi:hypothetical protein
VFGRHDRLGHALEAHKLDVVGAKHVEHAGAGDAQHGAREIPAQRKGRHGEVPPILKPERQPTRRIVRPKRTGAFAEHWEPAQIHPENNDQHEADKKPGDRQPQ